MLTNVKTMAVRAQFSLARMLKFVNFKDKDLKMNVLIFKSKKSYVNHMSIICQSYVVTKSHHMLNIWK